MRRWRIVAFAAVCIIVVYVLAFFAVREEVTVTAVRANDDGDQQLATSRVYYFSKNPGLHRALYLAFVPLHSWRSDSHELLERGELPAGSTVYIDDVAWLYNAKAQGFEANLPGR